jgi:hypothetical protein
MICDIYEFSRLPVTCSTTISSKRSSFSEVLRLQIHLENMVLGILTAIAVCPAIVGTTEAVRQGQRKNSKELHRGLKSNLFVSCAANTRAGKEVNGSAIVLRNSKVRSRDCTTICLMFDSYTSRRLRSIIRRAAMKIIYSQGISSRIPNRIGVAEGKDSCPPSQTNHHNSTGST